MLQIYDFIKFMTRYNFYLKYSFKRIRQSSDSFIGLIYSDLIYLRNPRFVLCKNANFDVYCEARFDNLML